MSTDAQPETETEETAETGEETEPGESEGMSERTAKLILTLILLGAIWTVVVVLPETAYIVTGVLITLGWQKARTWREQRSADDGQDQEEVQPPDVGEALRRLVGDDNGVLLTRLRDDLQLPNTKAVKALLDADGIPFKAVRTRAGNGPAVHVKDIPPAPSPATNPHGDGCCCRSGDNTNTNNDPAGPGQKGSSVEAIGDGGRLVRLGDVFEAFLGEAAKHHQQAAPQGEVNTP
ncbi:hypothetical protein ACW4TU_18505 [Streptomyces sp. QTS52]